MYVSCLSIWLTKKLRYPNVFYNHTGDVKVMPQGLCETNINVNYVHMQSSCSHKKYPFTYLSLPIAYIYQYGNCIPYTYVQYKIICDITITNCIPYTYNIIICDITITSCIFICIQYK